MQAAKGDGVTYAPIKPPVGGYANPMAPQVPYMPPNNNFRPNMPPSMPPQFGRPNHNLPFGRPNPNMPYQPNMPFGRPTQNNFQPYPPNMNMNQYPQFPNQQQYGPNMMNQG